MPQGEEQREVLRKKQKSESLLVRKKKCGDASGVQREDGTTLQNWKILDHFGILFNSVAKSESTNT